MTHLRKKIEEELTQLSAYKLEQWSDHLASMVPESLLPLHSATGRKYVEGTLHNLLDELWSMVIVEQRRRIQELMSEEQRFII